MLKDKDRKIKFNRNLQNGLEELLKEGAIGLAWTVEAALLKIKKRILELEQEE